MMNKRIEELAQRYVTGKASTDERRELIHWLDHHPEHKSMIQEWKKIWDLTPDEEFNVNVEDAWKQFSKDHLLDTHNKSRVYQADRPVDNMVRFFRVAAVILVGVLAGYFVMEEMASTNNIDATAEAYVLQMEEMITGNGEKAKVMFSDGTEVTLNSASSIRFPREFQGQERIVHLNGEAYFNVAHDADHPFIIFANGTRVQVLGTEFNVRAWEEDPAVDVAVREGKVSVRSLEINNEDEENEVILTENLYTRVESGKAPAAAQQIDIVNYILWTNGGLHFDNTPFKQVLRDVERRFDVRINMSETDLLEVPFTSTFQYAELDEVLSVIGATIEAEYRREGAVIDFTL